MSFLPLFPSAMQLIHKHPHLVAVSIQLLDESTASFHISRIPCIEIGVGWIAQVFASSLAGRCWLATVLAAWAVCSQQLQAVAGGADCGSESEEGRAPGSQV